jgi:hypothetical protein
MVHMKKASCPGKHKMHTSDPIDLDHQSDRNSYPVLSTTMTTGIIRISLERIETASSQINQDSTTIQIEPMSVPVQFS